MSSGIKLTPSSLGSGRRKRDKVDFGFLGITLNFRKKVHGKIIPLLKKYCVAEGQAVIKAKRNRKERSELAGKGTFFDGLFPFWRAEGKVHPRSRLSFRSNC